MLTNADVCHSNYCNFILILKEKNCDIVCCNSTAETNARSVKNSETFLTFVLLPGETY
jgi:hypothetical protein